MFTIYFCDDGQLRKNTSRRYDFIIAMVLLSLFRILFVKIIIDGKEEYIFHIFETLTPNFTRFTR